MFEHKSAVDFSSKEKSFFHQKKNLHSSHSSSLENWYEKHQYSENTMKIVQENTQHCLWWRAKKTSGLEGLPSWVCTDYSILMN